MKYNKFDTVRRNAYNSITARAESPVRLSRFFFVSFGQMFIDDFRMFPREVVDAAEHRVGRRNLLISVEMSVEPVSPDVADEPMVVGTTHYYRMRFPYRTMSSYRMVNATKRMVNAAAERVVKRIVLLVVHDQWTVTHLRTNGWSDKTSIVVRTNGSHYLPRSWWSTRSWTTETLFWSGNRWPQTPKGSQKRHSFVRPTRSAGPSVWISSGLKRESLRSKYTRFLRALPDSSGFTAKLHKLFGSFFSLQNAHALPRRKTFHLFDRLRVNSQNSPSKTR